MYVCQWARACFNLLIVLQLVLFLFCQFLRYCYGEWWFMQLHSLMTLKVEIMVLALWGLHLMKLSNWEMCGLPSINILFSLVRILAECDQSFRVYCCYSLHKLIYRDRDFLTAAGHRTLETVLFSTAVE